MRCRIALLPTASERIAALQTLRTELAEVRTRAAAANIDPMLGIDDASLAWQVVLEQLCSAQTTAERDAALAAVQAFFDQLPDGPATQTFSKTRAAFAMQCYAQAVGWIRRGSHLPASCPIDERLAPLLRSVVMQSTGDPWWSMTILQRESTGAENSAGPDTPESNDPVRVARALENNLAARAALELGLTNSAWRAIASVGRPSDSIMERMLLDVLERQFTLQLLRRKDRDAAAALGLDIIRRDPNSDHANTVRTLMGW